LVSINEQRADAKIPCFFEQWCGVRKSEAARMLDGRAYDAIPERRLRRVPAHWVGLAMIEEARKWETEYEPRVKAAQPLGSMERRPLLS
jgi:hypothetical protein